MLASPIGSPIAFGRAGTFGLFGTDKSDLTSPALNYAGVALAVVALVLYTQVLVT